ncbi:MAG: lipopolysaccharide heptosyltransferase II, partial [Acidobacteria bacterium]|nr:lipopolysaccharide heptosyltransferase II [Acidobacteriota bacterium]
IIFGPTDENGTGPLNPGARIVKHAVPCSPCFLRRCPIDHRCMGRISVDEVWRTVEEVLAAERRSQTPQAGAHP